MSEKAATAATSTSDNDPAGHAIVPPGGRGPAIIVGITLAILSAGAIALLVLAFTMPRVQPEADEAPQNANRTQPPPAGTTDDLTTFETPLKVTLTRDVRREEHPPPSIAKFEPILVQVHLYHSRLVELRSFRVEISFIDGVAEPDDNNGNDDARPRIWLVESDLPGVEATSLFNEHERDYHDGVALTLTPFNMPIRTHSDGRKIASLWVSLPLKKDPSAAVSPEIVLQRSDTLVATIVEVDPFLSTKAAHFALTEFDTD